jgi:hypothetical protein
VSNFAILDGTASFIVSASRLKRTKDGMKRGCETEKKEICITPKSLLPIDRLSTTISAQTYMRPRGAIIG